MTDSSRRGGGRTRQTHHARDRESEQGRDDAGSQLLYADAPRTPLWQTCDYNRDGDSYRCVPHPLEASSQLGLASRQLSRLSTVALRSRLH